VDIGAFRTYPENYTPPNVSASEYQSIPLSKIEDFGVHANQYYQLEVEVFKSSLDNDLLAMLWNKYWVNTLSQSPLVSVSNLNLGTRQSNNLLIEQGICCFTVGRSTPKIDQGREYSWNYKGACPNSQRQRRIITEGKLSSFPLLMYANVSQEKDEKKKEDNQLVKSVKDR